MENTNAQQLAEFRMVHPGGGNGGVGGGGNGGSGGGGTGGSGGDDPGKLV